MPLTLRNTAQPLDPLARGFGLQAWSYDAGSIAANTAPTAGTIYGVGLYLNQGQIATNVLFNVNIAGAGTVPTAIYCGLASATAMIGKSADVKASAVWTSASTIGSIPLVAPALIPASGMYYVLILQVGSWGTTQHTMNRHIVVNLGTPAATTYSAATFGTAQTVLPADGASPGTITVTSALRYWAGVS